jgi:hypothetical protein
MRKAATPKSQQEDDELKEALAALISCTHSKARPLPLTEVGHWLSVALKKLGSYAAVADRIGLSPKMLRQFGYVDRLSRPVQNLFQNRTLDSVDAAAHLAMLPKGEQLAVARAAASGRIDTGDIRAVTQLRKATGRGADINALLERVEKSKTKREYVAEFVVRGRRDRRELEKVLRNSLPPGTVIRVEISGSLGRLVLTQGGKKALAKRASEDGVPLRRVIPTILQGVHRQ